MNFATDILSIIISALISFSFLSLATFGIVLIFKTSSTTNFAQGMLGILGAYTTSYLIDKQGVVDVTGLPSVTITSPTQLILPILAGILVSFITGFLINNVIFKHAKFTNAATKQIITMGLVIVITGLIPLIFGQTVTRVSFPFSQQTIMFQGIAVPVHQLITLILSTIILLTIFILLKYTKWGLGVRSVASNERVAGMMGINTSVINSMSWAIAGALGALSAITYTAAIGSMSVVTMTSIQINAFYASILGGFSSFGGPLGGAFLLSAGQAIFPKLLVTWNLAAWSNTLLYVSIILAVLIKPAGLFGKKIVKKV
ncbi:MAG: branched-chain amino acid ABC transporter permease [Acholeplasmataceae bacterium]|jgi:branched-chain amino acid transport system permease protein|nr:branched-chain amino acid ABC transporter permease [Acholeplasmataceae bacterium]MDD4194694.1 branched-chain amino acid ABC transporter permease [Acholeplasmataceae bacterium]MDY0339034.1 branched-chain amino acid ABC transporter permease [Acholeplasmataceae bacterium]